MELPMRRGKTTLKMDIIKSFGADLDQDVRDSLFFISENMNAIVYPVGHHIAIRDLFVREDLRKNDIMFIHNDTDVKKITAMNCSRDHNLLLVCEKKEKVSCISVYNLVKLNFNTISLFKPKRKVISTIFRDYIYASFSLDGNYITALANNYKDNTTSLVGIVWDIQIFQPFREDNYKPRCVFEINQNVNKISIETKLICTSGNGTLSFWYIYENNVKEFKHSVKNLNIVNNNFIDHDWIAGKVPTLVIITEKNDIYILEGYFDKKDAKKRRDDDEDLSLKIEKFVIKQHIVNCFSAYNITPSIIRSYSKGLIAGSLQGHILFVEKTTHSESPYQVIRHIVRDKPAKVNGLSFNNTEEYLVIAYNTNEICYMNIDGINVNLKNRLFEIRFELVCDGFHQGPITSMDVALQRPIIITSSQADKTIRVWNYLTGHCEYCKIILTEKDDIEKEMDILAVAIHPNGYYIAVSDREMIRFFHLCYKELRFYNNDVVSNENPKANCHLLKFSHGGHLLAAVSGRTLIVMRAYTRETLKIFRSNHSGQIKNVVFHETDYYVYTIGNDGMIIEYNLFDFRMEELSTKYINYSDGEICSISNKSSIVACGYQSSNKYSICQVDVGPERNENSVFQLTQPALSLCHIKSKRFEISALAVGTEDGYINILPYPFDANIWDFLKSHRNEITHLRFSRETNLIFSAGADGNLFIYCIHEIQEESIGGESQKQSFNQLSSVLDEGLGENVLYPLDRIFHMEEELKELKYKVAENYKNEERLIKENEKKMKERETEFMKKKEVEISQLNDIIKEIKISKDSTIEHYENQIKQIIQENNKVLIDKEKAHNERIDQLSNQIHELNAKINFLKNEHEMALKFKDDEYERKFKELERDLKKKFDEVKSVNEKLNEEIFKLKILEEKKFSHLDQEHEQEIAYKQDKYENMLAALRDEKTKIINENFQLKEALRAKETSIQEKDTKIKKMSEQIEQLTISLQNAKKLNEMKDNEFRDLKIKLNESEKELQEKSKLAGFSMKLKNELYKKNIEVMGNYNIQQGNINELKVNSKNIEKELEEAMRMLENNEKEMNKQKLLISELKRKCEEEHKYGKTKETELDELLQKFYEVFQSNDKNTILKGLRQIYSLYLTPEVVNKIDASKLNVNIRDELEKQIDFLQKSLLNVTELKSKKENIQKNEIFKRTEQNSVLINQLNEKIRNYTILERDYNKLKSEHSALVKTLENYKRQEKENRVSMPQQKNMLFPEIFRSQELLQNNSEDLYVLKNQAMAVSHNFESLPFGQPGSPGLGPQQFNPIQRGKLFRGSVAAKNKLFSDTYKVNELIKIIEDKDDIIQRLRDDIQKIKNETLIIKDSSIINDPNFSNNLVKLQNANLANLNLPNNEGEEELI